MAETPSTMVDLGTEAPDFSLPEPKSGHKWSYSDVRGQRGTLVVFLCNHCPYVKHIADELAEVASEYQMKGIGFVGISSNDADSYPADRPEEMVKEADRRGYEFPYLYDESQQVARAYSAACTPDFFLFNANDRLVYRGQFDAARPGNDEPIDGSDLREAMDALIAGKDVDENQVPSVGCNIKWKRPT
jgi:peroxiredoxin